MAPFLKYQRVIKAIPGDWKTILKNTEKDTFKAIQFDVKRNTYVYLLMKSKKGYRDFYEVLVGTQQIYTHSKWKNEIDDVDTDWKFSYSFLKEILEVKIRNFQYKILHNILVTNSFLKKKGKGDSDL